jgi:hypothetical protein
MRRSLTYCEPKLTLAGKRGTWRFIYCPNNDLPKGCKLKFDLLSEGKPTDWQVPQVNQKNKENLIWGELQKEKTIKAKVVDSEDEYNSQFEFTLPSALKAGDNFIINMGTPTNDGEKKGTLCQTITQRRRSFHLFIDPKGKGDYKDPEIFHIDIKGNVLSNLKIIAPSFVARNKRFDVIVRFEDEFGNLTSNAPEGTLIDLSYEHLRDNLNWKLFVPETGFLTLPNLYFNEPGIYRIQLSILETEDQFFSSPIKCFADSDLQLFWGTMHGESQRYDSNENLENCLRYFRDDKAYQFYGASGFDSEKETSSDFWKTTQQYVSEFNEDERFNVFLGFQWVGEPKEEGVRQFIYSKDNKSIFRKEDLKNNSLKKIYKSNNPKELMAIPSFSMGKSIPYNFEDYNPEFERVVEIYNAWGSSECRTKDGNTFPIKANNRKGVNESNEGSVQNALLNNCRFGFIAGGLDDRGVYEDFYDNDQTQYPPGLTGIIAKNQTRESMFDALSKRSCYATTGVKILLGFNIAQKPMGSETDTLQKPGLVFNRYISGYVIGTDKIKEISIIRNGKILTSMYPKKDQVDFSFDDTDNINVIAIRAKNSPNPFVYYYLKIEQEDGNVAWSSPIWVDFIKKPPKIVK